MINLYLNDLVINKLNENAMKIKMNFDFGEISI